MLVSYLYVDWFSNESTLKKVVKKNISNAGELLPFSEKRQKTPKFDKAPSQYH